MATADLFGFALSGLIGNPDLVLSARVGDVGNAPAVRRPRDGAVIRSRAVGEVAGRALFRRHGENVPTGYKDRAFALRRNAESAHVVGHRHAPRPLPQPVVQHGDDQRGIAAVVDIEDVELAVEFVDNPALVIGARPTNVPQIGFRDLLDRPATRIKRIEIEAVVAVGGKVDLVADPHWISLGADRMGYGLDFVARQIEDEEVLSPAALIALPMAEVSEERRVDHLRSIGREVGGAGVGHRQGFWQSAGERHRVDLCFHAAPSVTKRAEKHLLAIRGPAIDLVVVAPARRQRPNCGVPGQSRRFATGGRHHIDLLVTVVLTGERNPFAIRREPAEQLLTRMRGEPASRPAIGRCQPQITAVAEDHLVSMNIRETQQPGPFLGLDTGSNKQEAQNTSQYT